MGKPSSTDVVLCFKLGKNKVFSLNLTAIVWNADDADKTDFTSGEIAALSSQIFSEKSASIRQIRVICVLL